MENEKYPSRKIIRLKEYDYSSSGCYHITICTKNRQELFGSVGTRIARPLDACPFDTHIVHLSDIGYKVEFAMLQINLKYKSVLLDKYIIMPNHIHMILIINKTDETGRVICDEIGRAMRVPTISTVINQFKGYATKQIGFSLWQSRFYDHIIRDEKIIWKYVNI